MAGAQVCSTTARIRFRICARSPSTQWSARFVTPKLACRRTGRKGDERHHSSRAYRMNEWPLIWSGRTCTTGRRSGAAVGPCGRLPRSSTSRYRRSRLAPSRRRGISNGDRTHVPHGSLCAPRVRQSTRHMRVLARGKRHPARQRPQHRLGLGSSARRRGIDCQGPGGGQPGTIRCCDHTCRQLRWRGHRSAPAGEAPHAST